MPRWRMLGTSHRLAISLVGSKDGLWRQSTQSYWCGSMVATIESEDDVGHKGQRDKIIYLVLSLLQKAKKSNAVCSLSKIM